MSIEGYSAAVKEVEDRIAALSELDRAKVVVAAQIIRSVVGRGEPEELALARVFLELAKEDICDA